MVLAILVVFNSVLVEFDNIFDSIFVGSGCFGCIGVLVVHGPGCFGCIGVFVVFDSVGLLLVFWFLSTV